MMTGRDCMGGSTTPGPILEELNLDPRDLALLSGSFEDLSLKPVWVFALLLSWFSKINNRLGKNVLKKRLVLKRDVRRETSMTRSRELKKESNSLSRKNVCLSQNLSQNNVFQKSFSPTVYNIRFHSKNFKNPVVVVIIPSSLEFFLSHTLF